jgi:hypothetical protein
VKLPIPIHSVTTRHTVIYFQSPSALSWWEYSFISSLDKLAEIPILKSAEKICLLLKFALKCLDLYVIKTVVFLNIMESKLPNMTCRKYSIKHSCNVPNMTNEKNLCSLKMVLFFIIKQ